MRAAYVDVKGHYAACGLAIRAIRRGALVVVAPLPADEYRVLVQEEVKHLLGPVTSLMDMGEAL